MSDELEALRREIAALHAEIAVLRQQQAMPYYPVWMTPYSPVSPPRNVQLVPTQPTTYGLP